jgi:hypothetical protein
VGKNTWIALFSPQFAYLSLWRSWPKVRTSCFHPHHGFLILSGRRFTLSLLYFSTESFYMGPAGIFVVVGVFFLLTGRRRAGFWSLALAIVVGMLWNAVFYKH